MDDWHNGTIQGQRNSAISRLLKERASMEMVKWRRANKNKIEEAGGIPAPWQKKDLSCGSEKK